MKHTQLPPTKVYIDDKIKFDASHVLFNEVG